MPRKQNDLSQNSLNRSEKMVIGPQGRGAGVQTANEGIDAFKGDLIPNSNMSGISTLTDASPPSMRTPHSHNVSSQLQSAGHHTYYGRRDDKLDISPENKQTRKNLLRDSIFTDWKDDASSADLGDPGEMQKKDPLRTMIWKLYSKTKTQLPNSERMENLTWRMMAMDLKRKERELALYVEVTPLPSAFADMQLSLRANQQPANAHLRTSVDFSNTPDPEAMNIDDFIFPTSIASPAGLSATPPTPPIHTTAPGIPIQTKKDIHDQSHPNFPPSAPPHDGMRGHEFDYVQRRVRKTSIDETRVIFCFLGRDTPKSIELTGNLNSLESDLPSFPRK